MKGAERPIALLGRGDDLYLTVDGYFAHAPKETEKTLFAVDHTVNQFVFKGKSYELANICGNRMTYKNLQHSVGLEMSFILSYEKIGTINDLHFGKVTVVGNLPKCTLFVKIMDKWHERKILDSTAALFEAMEVNYWTTEDQKQTFKMWKPYFEKY